MNFRSFNPVSVRFIIFSFILLTPFISSFSQDPSKPFLGPKISSQEYRNPVLTGFFPDPSVVKVGDDYYCVNSTFEYFPAIIISHSKDLVHWKQIGHVFDKSADLDLTAFWDGMGIWAPDISYHDGEFYVFYCLVQLKKDRSYNVRGNYMVKSKSISGPWSEPVQLTDHGNDPSHFVDVNGDHYMLFAAGIPVGNGTRIVKLSKDCRKTEGDPVWLETAGKKAAPEGPHLIQKDGYYYLTMAASGGLFQGHHMLVARSKNMLGPYENSPYNPLLAQRDSQAVNFHQGHGKIFQTQKGEWFTMVLSQRRLSDHMKDKPAVKGVSPLGRETSLIGIEWTEDGWPRERPVRKPLDIGIKPDLPEFRQTNRYSDEFDALTLTLPWQFRRNPLEGFYDLSEKKGFLRLYSSNHDIDTILGRNLIVQRERSHHYEASTFMIFHPETREQAGITCYYDTKTYARLGLQRDSLGKLVLLLEQMIKGKPDITHVVTNISSTSIFLKVIVDRLKRTFQYSYDGISWHHAGTIEHAWYLSDQGTPIWGFMGTMVGLYSFNRGTNRRIPADFDWFRVNDTTPAQ